MRSALLRVLCVVPPAFLQAAPASAATCTVAPSAPKGSYSETLAVSYSASESGNVIKRVDDINPPVVLFIHGGWFQHNSADGLDPEARALAYNAHVAVFNIDYHLTIPQNPASATINQFPVAVQDARCAARWVANPANGTAWGFDSTRMGVIGFSAGANLAAMIVTASGSAYDDPSCPNAGQALAIKGVAGYYGVYDFATGTWPAAKQYIGGQALNSPTATAASPQFWVSAAGAPYPPYFFARGTSDPLFPESQQDDFAAALQAVGDTVILDEVPGAVHGFGAFNVVKMPAVTQSACDLVAFFGANL